MRVKSIVTAAAILLSLFVSNAAESQSPSSFDGWAAIILAGDWTDSRGDPIDAFDNARRDIATAFQTAGFESELMTAYSLRPDHPEGVTAQEALHGATETARRASRGCLVYFTSHGSPGQIVFGPGDVLEPGRMNALISGWCGTRPTVIVVSACYAGGFIDALSQPNRMVVTAAREDRTSFGCGADAVYPYFDGCIIQSLETAPDFIALAHQARTCVSAREDAEGLSPASEPQVRIGGQMQLLLPTLRFQPPNSTHDGAG